MNLDLQDRDLAAIRLPRTGKVVSADGPVAWLVIGQDREPVEPVLRYLRDFVARGYASGSVRSYAYDLLRWWRFLSAVDVAWDKATSVEVRDLVLWLQLTTKERTSPRTLSAGRSGTINPVTRKQYLTDGYQPRTIRHSNAVLRSFYDYWIELGEGPLVNPVPRERLGHRANAHHNPLEPYRNEGRLRYNPKVPRSRPRAMADERWTDLFAAMPSNRDRAILALAISTAARASEVLGLRSGDIDWGDQLVRVTRKGSGAKQWLPASPDAFVWLRLYLNESAEVGCDVPLWLTLRRRRQGSAPLERLPLTYDALRAVLRRANAHLGANWTMHDLRHTAALRMIHDQRLSLRDVQTILGHSDITTTQVYLNDDEQEVIGRVRQYLSERDTAAARPAVPAPGYRSTDLAVLLGGASV